MVLIGGVMLSFLGLLGFIYTRYKINKWQGFAGDINSEIALGLGLLNGKHTKVPITMMVIGT